MLSIFPSFPQKLSHLGQGPTPTTQVSALDVFERNLEKELAHRHLNLIFSHPELASALFAQPFGPQGEDLQSKQGILEKIDREGLPGYFDLLVAALNQYWAPVSMAEDLRSRGACPRDEAFEAEHLCGLKFISDLLGHIEEDPIVREGFERRWGAFSRTSSLADIRNTVAGALSSF